MGIRVRSYMHFFKCSYLCFQACRKKAIDCIVAPYEADAQLAYLDKIGMAQLIITEDSDLILFGCTRVRIFSISSQKKL